MTDNKELWFKVKVFHHDLMTFDQNTDAKKRLDYDPMAFCFMSSVYFTESELEYLLMMPTATSGSGSCKEYLNNMIYKKTENKNATLCSSHDIATAIASIYGIRKEYTKDKEFKSFLKEFGKLSKNK